MCGICGIISIKEPGRPVDIQVLNEMTDVMMHRGPDGRGIWVSDNSSVAFGHRRLAIIDLSAKGAQPMANEDRSVWITFNGEIYNYQSLRRRLMDSGHVFKSKSDTEVLVHLYEEVGDDMVYAIDGDYAFAIWDGRRNRLFLARDPAGVKPLYYAWAGPYFIFASELKSILKHPFIQKSVDEEALYHYLTYLAVPAPMSMVKGVHKACSGEYITLDDAGRMEKRLFWEPIPSQYRINENNLDLQLEELLAESVRKRLMSDVPVGVLFSGGVDSSLNALLFQKLVQPESVHTFNVWMAASDYINESRSSRSMAEYIGTNHHSFELKEDDIIYRGGDIYDQAFWQDEPIADPASESLHFITQHARNMGMTVLQAGEGADEIFCGYDGYRNWMNREKYLWTPLCKLPRSIAALGYQLLGGLSIPKWKKIADVLRRRSIGQDFFMSEAVGYYELEKMEILSPQFRQKVRGMDSFEIVRPLYERLREVAPQATFLQQLTYIELRLRLPELLLMRADKLSMANSVELRVPFLDRSLVEFALSIPESFKLRNGISKEPLKRLATIKLQNSLEERHQRFDSNGSLNRLFYGPKWGLGAPIEAWLRSKLGKRTRTFFQDNKEEFSEYFDMEHVFERIDKEMTVGNQSYQLWAIYCFTLWKKRFGL
jgi:asparagine synthase (glutamine-hydrolysing)